MGGKAVGGDAAKIDAAIAALVESGELINTPRGRGTRSLLPLDALVRQFAAAVSARAGGRRDADEPVGLLQVCGLVGPGVELDGGGAHSTCLLLRRD